MTLSGHLGYRDGLLKQYRRYALNFQGYATDSQSPVRYRFDLDGDRALRYDVIIEGEQAR